MSPSSDDTLPTASAQQAPNAAAVGREFVRQYYTLLNQAPLHLHRFYSANSSFVHGSLDGGGVGGASSPDSCGGGGELDQAVRGQQEIHQRIMALGFRNCRAKIRQVDSHATLGDGVVVQVAGELSNDDRPHRRFMQTFVLAPQSHKKYYVHNDIFRYQDEVFGDKMSTADGIPSPPSVSVDAASRPKSNGDRHEMEKCVGLKQPTQPQPEMAPPAAAEASVLAQAAETLQKQQQAAAAVAAAQYQLDQKKGSSGVAVGPVMPQGQTTVEENGSGAAADQAARRPIAGQVRTNQPLHKDNSAPPALGPQQPTREATDPALISKPPPPSAPAEPMSYASLVKTGPPSGAAAAAGVASGNAGDASSKADGRSRGHVTKSVGEVAKSDEVKPLQQQSGAIPMRTMGGSAPAAGCPRPSGGSGRGVGSGPVQQYSDVQQLFVGNLPHNCTEDDLRELFCQWGRVADIRISNKGAAQSKQTPAGTRVPNFGFVIFEETRAVQRVLAHLDKRPIFLYDNHRLNVEEKKTKVRSDNNAGDRTSGGVAMGGNPLDPRGGGRGHHHGGSGRGDGGFDHHQRGSSQDYNTMGRGMIGECRGRGGSSVRGGGPMGRGGGANRGGGASGGGPSQSGPFKKKPPVGNSLQQLPAANSHM